MKTQEFLITRCSDMAINKHTKSIILIISLIEESNFLNVIEDIIAE